MSSAVARTYRDPDAIVRQACEIIATGKTTKYAAKECGIDGSTLWRYVTDSPELRKLYADARSLQARALADEVVDLSDTATAENAQAVRLQVDARKWHASKTAPREFGDKLDLTVSPDNDTGPGEQRLAALMAALPAALALLPLEQRQALQANLMRLAPMAERVEIVQDAAPAE